MPEINPLVADTGSPPIPEAYGWTERYGGKHGPLVLLSQAAPSQPPPDALLERLAQSAREPATARYGDICGDDALRGAYAREISVIYGTSVAPANIAITAGCNLGFVAAAMALARAGDAVLLPSPWYFNHKMTLDMLGIEARVLPCSESSGFVPDPQAATRLIDAKVKAIVLVTPNNPTGAVYPPATIAAFHEICRRHGITLVLDETYRDFTAPETGAPHALARGGWPDDVIQLYSFSKAFHIPGYRLGAITASVRMVTEIAKLLDCLQICAPRVAQGPIAWALQGLAPWRAANRNRIVGLERSFARAFRQLDGWQLLSIGSYFAYARHPFPGVSANAVAERIAAERGVLCLPATFFGPGQEAYLRIAFANLDPGAIEGIVARLDGISMR